MTTSYEPTIVVIPCYNEEQRMQLDAFRDFFLSAESAGIGLLFIDDGSTDATFARISSLREEFPDRVRLERQPRNGGKAEAVRAGMRYASAVPGTQFTGYWDADLATPLSELPRLLRVFDDYPGLEAVLGSRVRLLGRRIERLPARHYSGRIFATLASIAIRLAVYDTQCGAKLFRVTPTLDAVLAEPFHSRWIFDVELLARFMKRHGDDPSWAGRAIREEPLLEWEDIKGSKLRGSDAVRALAELYRISRLR